MYGLNEEQKSIENSVTSSRKKLSIKIVGHGYIDAFEVENRTGNQPHYKGDGVAVWIHNIKNKVNNNE